MAHHIIAEYSKARVLEITLGPFVLLGVGYLLLSPYSLDYVFSAENLARVAGRHALGLVAAPIFLGLIVYQIVTICLMGKKFIWTEGKQLYLGYRPKGRLNDFMTEEATVAKIAIGQTVTLPNRDGTKLTIRTAYSRISGEELLNRIKAAQADPEI